MLVCGPVTLGMPRTGNPGTELLASALAQLDAANGPITADADRMLADLPTSTHGLHKYP